MCGDYIKPCRCSLQTQYVDLLSKYRALHKAADRIHHWHDRDPDGMVVSADAVRELWRVLAEVGEA